jgi:hypothetical protein
MLGIVDTIEPLKLYRDGEISDIDILKSINFEFGKNYLRVKENNSSKINFNKLITQTEYFRNRLNVQVIVWESMFELVFK